MEEDKTDSHSCDLCGLRYTTQAKLESHKRQHFGQKPFACSSCPAVFSTRAQLSRHKKCHDGAVIIECEDCGGRLCSKKALQNHQLVHQPAYAENWINLHRNINKPEICEDCGYFAINVTLLQKHLSIHQLHAPVFACNLCNAVFAKEKQLVNHKGIDHNGIKLFACEMCEAKFGTNKELRSHKFVHQCDPLDSDIDKDVDVRKSKYLEMLGISTRGKKTAHSIVKDADTFETKVALKEQELSCDEAGEDDATTKKQQKLQLKQTKEKYSCEKCNSKFTSKRNQKSHVCLVFKSNISSSGDEEEMKALRHLCEVYEIQFNSKEDLKSHECIYPSQDSSSDRVEEQVKVARYSCEVCCMGFHSKKDLKGHKCLNTSPNSSTYYQKNVIKSKRSCNVCHLEFNSKVELRSHECLNTLAKSSTHQQKKVSKSNRSCKICLIEFSSRAELKDHECGGNIRDISYTHQDHTSEQCKYFCDFCNVKFDSKTELKGHECTQTPYNLSDHTVAQSKYSCEFCNEQFSSKKKLKAHVCDFDSTHHLEKRLEETKRRESSYSCDICCKECKSKKDLSEHECMQRFSDTQQVAILLHSKYPCYICSTAFNSKRKFKVHSCFSDALPHSKKFWQETSAKIYTCKSCFEEFSKRRELKSHECVVESSKRNSEHFITQTRYMCKNCNLECYSKRDLKHHTCTQEPDQFSVSQATAMKSVHIYMCSACHTTFKAKKKLQSHVCPVDLTTDSEQLNMMLLDYFGNPDQQAGNFSQDSDQEPESTVPDELPGDFMQDLYQQPEEKMSSEQFQDTHHLSNQQLEITSSEKHHLFNLIDSNQHQNKTKKSPTYSWCEMSDVKFKSDEMLNSHKCTFEECDFSTQNASELFCIADNSRATGDRNSEAFKPTTQDSIHGKECISIDNLDKSDSLLQNEEESNFFTNLWTDVENEHQPVNKVCYGSEVSSHQVCSDSSLSCSEKFIESNIKILQPSSPNCHGEEHLSIDIGHNTVEELLKSTHEVNTETFTADCENSIFKGEHLAMDMTNNASCTIDNEKFCPSNELGPVFPEQNSSNCLNDERTFIDTGYDTGNFSQNNENVDSTLRVNLKACSSRSEYSSDDHEELPLDMASNISYSPQKDAVNSFSELTAEELKPINPKLSMATESSFLLTDAFTSTRKSAEVDNVLKRTHSGPSDEENCSPKKKARLSA